VSRRGFRRGTPAQFPQGSRSVKSAVPCFFFVLGLSLFVSAAQAQDSDVCLPLEAHQAILADLRELRGDGAPGAGLRGRVGLLDTKLTLQTAQLADLRLAEGLAVQAKQAAMAALTAAVRGQREAEESRDAWYRAPTLWFGTGLVGALVIAIVARNLAAN